MSFTNYLELRVLDHLFGGESFAKPTSVWVALSIESSEEGEEIENDGTGITEPSTDAGYARVEIINTQPEEEWEEAEWHDAELVVGPDEYEIAQKRNAVVLEFPEATADWGEITHFAIFDAATDGNMLAYGELYQSVPYMEGNQRSFSDRDLVITLD